MTKRRKKKWLKAIKKLIDYYYRYSPNDIPVNHEIMLKKPCPLCKVAHNKCEKCLWAIFEGGRCVSKRYWRDTAKERIIRLGEWETKLKEEEK